MWHDERPETRDRLRHHADRRRGGVAPLFARGTALPGAGEAPLEPRRRYDPAHNIGHFFPLVPSLADRADLAAVPVARDPAAAARAIEEVVRCDASGRLTVTLENATAGHARSYTLGHRGARSAPSRPGRRRSRPR